MENCNADQYSNSGVCHTVVAKIACIPMDVEYCVSIGAYVMSNFEQYIQLISAYKQH